MDMATWIMLGFYIIVIGGVSVWALLRCLKNNQWEETN